MNFQNHKKSFIIAEVSANHGQKLSRAIAMIKAAKLCGVDAVKFQAYTPDNLTINVQNKYFQIKHHKWGGQTLYELYSKAYTPWRWFKDLKKVADDLNIIFFATVFDKASLDFLEELEMPFYKIASFELVDLPLIEYVAKTKKPLILSTGMAAKQEIRDAVITARKFDVADLALLKCVSSYPARPDEMNLRTIIDLAKSFKCTVGLSDHTLGTAVSVAAVANGAKIIEKHFTLSRKIRTPDSFFSLEPDELTRLVNDIRVAEVAMGKVKYNFLGEEAKSKIFRRSLFIVADIKKGDVFTLDNVRSIRPSNGLHPQKLKNVLGKKASRAIKKGTPLSWKLVA